MQIGKPQFFILLSVLVAGPFWAVRGLWVIRSVKTQGLMEFVGHGDAGEQVRLDYSVIRFKAGEKDVWFNGLGNIGYRSGQPVPIRYQPGDPYDAKVDVFDGIWGDTLVYSGIPVFMLLVMFLHPKVVPRGSRLRLAIRRPFIRIISSKSVIHG